MIEILFTAVLLACQGAQTGELLPVRGIRPDFMAIPGLVSDDGRYVYEGMPIGVIDVATGRSTGGEVVMIEIVGAKQLRGASRTTSQGLGPDSWPPGRLFATAEQPTFWGDAQGKDRLLVCAQQQSPYAPHDGLIVLSEIKFDKRGENPNADWVLHLRGHVKARPIGARFIGTNKVELEVLEAEAGRHCIVTYRADRESAGSQLKEHSKVALRRFPSQLSYAYSLDINQFNPIDQTYIYSDRDGTARLVTAIGTVTASARPSNFGPRSNPELEAIWSLRVHEAAVPGGKAAWRPLAMSGNGRYWLVRSVATGEFHLLHIKS